MSRVPATVYMIQLTKRIPAGCTAQPPAENHSFNNLTEMTIWRDQALKRPSTKVIKTFMMIDETTPQSHQAAIAAIDERTRLHSERVKQRARA